MGTKTPVRVGRPSRVSVLFDPNAVTVPHPPRRLYPTHGAGTWVLDDELPATVLSLPDVGRRDVPVPKKLQSCTRRDQVPSPASGVPCPSVGTGGDDRPLDLVH